VNECCVCVCVFRAFDAMKLGLSNEEAYQVLKHLDDAGHIRANCVNIQGFLEYFGGGERRN